MRTTLVIFCITLFAACNTTTGAKRLDKNITRVSDTGLVVIDTAKQLSSGNNQPVNNNEEDDEDKYNAAITNTFDSLTASWQPLQPANPDGYFQKQYSGTINNQKAILNVNLRAINIRQQKDLVIWAAIGDTVLQVYIGEANVFGVSVKDSSTLPICPGCRHDSLVLKNHYLLGWTENSHPVMAARFTKDSTQLEGFYYSHRRKIVTPFTLTLSSPSLPLNYIVYRYHKHQQGQGDEVKEVASTVLLGVYLPNPADENYNTLLEVATGVTKNGNTKTLDAAANDYKKTYLAKVKQSHISYARSLIGTYDNTEVIYNQHNWLVLRKEGFTGDAEYYGDMGYDYICYDITQHRLISEEDVLVDDYAKKLEDITNNERLRDFAFACSEGVFFRISGNHGWDVGLTFINWQQIKPLLKQSFINQHATWLNGIIPSSGYGSVQN